MCPTQVLRLPFAYCCHTRTKKKCEPNRGVGCGRSHDFDAGERLRQELAPTNESSTRPACIATAECVVRQCTIHQQSLPLYNSAFGCQPLSSQAIAPSGTPALTTGAGDCARLAALTVYLTAVTTPYKPPGPLQFDREVLLNTQQSSCQAENYLTLPSCRPSLTSQSALTRPQRTSTMRPGLLMLLHQRLTSASNHGALCRILSLTRTTSMSAKSATCVCLAIM